MTPPATSNLPLIRTILAVALDATGAERAFLVSFLDPADPGKHRIEAALSARADGNASASRSVLRWAFSERDARVGVDAEAGNTLPEDASVRALGLRQMLSACVPGRDLDRRSLVLDGRSVPTLAPADLVDLLEAFACLIGLVLRDPPKETDGPAPRRPELPGGRALVGRSPAFLELLRQVAAIASWRLPVLILGESGSGKEGIARALHDQGPNAAGPFVAVNCSAIPESLLESELFGAVRGAYTGSDQDRPGLFRLAQGGTLFLDEVGDMPPAMQAKLLRALQEGRVRPVGARSDVAVQARIVTATHRNLLRLVEEGRFREDLYWRLATVPLRVPPLRTRLEDLPLLVEHLSKRLEAATNTKPIRVSDGAMQTLLAHPWPGNVRELEAVLARAVLRSRTGAIEAPHLDLAPHGGPDQEAACTPPALERAMIEAALHQSAGSITRAAARIGWSRPKLYRRISALGLTVNRPARRRAGVPS